MCPSLVMGYGRHGGGKMEGELETIKLFKVLNQIILCMLYISNILHKIILVLAY